MKKIVYSFLDTMLTKPLKFHFERRYEFRTILKIYHGDKFIVRAISYDNEYDGAAVWYASHYISEMVSSYLCNDFNEIEKYVFEWTQNKLDQQVNISSYEDVSVSWLDGKIVKSHYPIISKLIHNFIHNTITFKFTV